MLEINEDTCSARDSDGPATPTEDDEKGSVIRFPTHLPSICSYDFYPTDEEDGTASLTFISIEESESEAGAAHGLSIFNFGSNYNVEYPGGDMSDEYELDAITRMRKAQTPRRNTRRRKHARSLSDFAASKHQRSCFSQMCLRPRNGRTNSGTPVIASIGVLNKSFPEYYVDYSSSCCFSESRSDTELEFSTSLTNRTKGAQSPRNMMPFRDRSKTRNEIPRRCTQILVSGGPRAGFYDMKDRVQGRRSWATDQSEIHWSVGAKAWILRSTKARRGMCVAMLKEDTITPYGSPQPWRVSLAGRTRSVHDSYAFTPDMSMTCTPASGFGVLGDLPEITPALKLNTLVRIRRGLGVTRFIGELEDEDKVGTFVGIELFSPNGLHNGIRKKMSYFEAKENHGIFVRYPGGIIEQFGKISQMGEVILGNLLSKGRELRTITIKLENSIARTLLAIFDHRKIFCVDRDDILELILLYELAILC